MTFSVVYERVTDPNFPSGYYYAHIPTLDLTTHGPGIEGAREASTDLVHLWQRKRWLTVNQFKWKAQSNVNI